MLKKISQTALIITAIAMAIPSQAKESAPTPQYNIPQTELWTGSDESMAAAKSFSAWSVKNYKACDGDWNCLWNGWLKDPQVPENFKKEGLFQKQELFARLEKMQQQIDAMKAQAESGAQEMMEQADKMMQDSMQKFKELEQSAKDNANQWLDNSIQGKN